MLRIRMSQAGYCSRRLTAMLLGSEGAPVPKWLNESADEGNWHEARLKDELRALGCEVRDDQLEIQLPTNSEYEVVGHIDGCVKPSPKLLHDSRFAVHYIDCSPNDITSSFFEQFCLGEMKTFSYLEHQRWVAEEFTGYFHHYGVQHTLYRHALNQLGISLLFSKDRSGGARNLYIIGKDPADFTILSAKFDEVAKCAEEGTLPFAEYNSESLECRRCNYKISQCAGKVHNASDVDVIIAAQDYANGASQEKEGKALKDIARDILLQYAIQTKQNQYKAGDYSVSRSNFSKEDAKTGLVHAVIDELCTIIAQSSDIKTDILRPVVEHLGLAISTSNINRITVSSLKKED